MIHDLHIHGIVDIKSGKNQETKLPGDPLYYYRKIVITDDRGAELTLHLFGVEKPTWSSMMLKFLVVSTMVLLLITGRLFVLSLILAALVMRMK
jgi:hypothetical protein